MALRDARFPAWLALLASGCAPGCWRREPLPMPDLVAVYGSEGVGLWAEGADGLVLQREEAGAWIDVSDAAPPWWDALTGGSPSRYRLFRPVHQLGGEPVSPAPLDLSLGLDRADRLYLSDEEVSFTLTSAGLSGVELAWGLSSGDLWWDGAEWTGEETALSAASGAVPASTSVPDLLPLSGWVALPADDGAWLPLDRVDDEIVRVGRRIAWGDLHAHSNLSNDGCEDLAQDCADRDPAGAAWDFYEQAEARGLDFAALTDHAEWMYYTPEGSEEALYVWDAQKAIVQAAEGGPVLPLLGYEWTWTSAERDEDNYLLGGHKSVIVSQLDACDDWRVAAGGTILETYTKGQDGGTFADHNERKATRPEDLWGALDAAAAACGGAAITFFHHPACSLPQQVDWSRPNNAPDYRYEGIVEIFSEHGASECRDLGAEGCGWRLRPGSDYAEAGSYQSALMQGYRLGLGAGTDSHDSMPGSVEDDAGSCTAIYLDGDYKCHDYAGGLTGVLVRGDLTREELFRAILARNTLGTSGLRPRIRAVVVDAAGGVWLPGDAIPAENAPFQLIASAEGEDEAASLEEIRLLAADGETLAFGGGPLLQAEVTLAQPAYLRLSFAGEEDGDGERVWVSPFFVDEPGESE